MRDMTQLRQREREREGEREREREREGEREREREKKRERDCKEKGIREIVKTRERVRALVKEDCEGRLDESLERGRPLLISLTLSNRQNKEMEVGIYPPINATWDGNN